MEGPERRCPKGIEAKFPSCIVFSLPKHCNGMARPRATFAASDTVDQSGNCLLPATTKVLCYKKWKSVMNMEYILLKSAAPSSMGRLACA